MEEANSIRIAVGLGNPGAQYEGTRHNAGFSFVERIAEEQGHSPKAWKKKGLSLVTEVRIAGRPLLLAKPQTFMNLSGNAVLSLMAETRAKPPQFLVICDDALFDAGKVRIRPSGSHGGQNGLHSIVDAIGSLFPRIRLGVGLCPPEKELSSHVLSRFLPEERERFQHLLEESTEMVNTILSEGLTAAMNRWNGA